ncbi:histidine--tRNA ligase [Candidatus Woesearchaeota archaeon]|nr:histidine--tRNA ligase [Candidatus Woesearchaeota archaeon]
MPKLEPVKGTRDLYPEQKYVQDFIFAVWKDVGERFGYEDMEGPLLEPAELWKLKSGSEIPEQMYVFTDKGNRQVAIRPELTPTIARMAAAKQKSLAKPLRWYSIGRFWRYEQPQSGRMREFWQFNCDCMGGDTMRMDAEVIAVSAAIMLVAGATEKDFYIRLGNRKLIQGLMAAAGVDKELIQEVSRLLDKKDKIGQENYELSLKDAGLSQQTIEALDKALSQKLEDVEEQSLDEEGKQGLEELKELVGLLKAYGLEELVEIDLSIVRGFDYYTSTVFEIFDRSKKLRAVAGGGRYENLVEDFGGERLAGIGFGMGDVVLELFLKNIGQLPEYQKDVDALVIAVDDSCYLSCIETAQAMRMEGLNIEIDLLGRKVGKQFEYADKHSVPYVIVIGPEEAAKKKVKLKDMDTGKEEILTVDQAMERIR